MPSIPVKWKRLHPDAKIPQYAHAGDSGADLCVVEGADIHPGEVRVLDCGFAIELPPGYELQVRSRSGLASLGCVVANSPGTIDEPYRGPICAIIANVGNHPFVVHAGDRVGQLVIAPVLRAEYIEVSELSESERGANGLGSSGVR